jgi:hypothetical protein
MPYRPFAPSIFYIFHSPRCPYIALNPSSMEYVSINSGFATKKFTHLFKLPFDTRVDRLHPLEEAGLKLLGSQAGHQSGNGIVNG